MLYEFVWLPPVTFKLLEESLLVEDSLFKSVTLGKEVLATRPPRETVLDAYLNYSMDDDE